MCEDTWSIQFILTDAFAQRPAISPEGYVGILGGSVGHLGFPGSHVNPTNIFVHKKKPIFKNLPQTPQTRTKELHTHKQMGKNTAPRWRL
jgi:hypothetical protein